MQKLDNYKNYRIFSTTDVSSLDQDFHNKILDFQEMQHQALEWQDVLRSRKYRFNKLQEKTQENYKKKLFYVLAEERIIATASTWYREYEEDENPESIEIYLFVDPEYREQGIGAHLFEFIKDHCHSIGREKYEAWTTSVDDDRVRSFLKDRGFSRVMVEKTSRLYKDKINWDFIKEKEEQLQGLSEKYRYEMMDRETWADKILNQEGFAEEMADFLTETINLIPKEEIEANKFVETAENLRTSARQMQKYPSTNGMNFYAFDDRNLIAMSGTFYPEDPPVKDVGTGLTAVRQKYHRQGLATKLKIMVIKEYAEKFPAFEYIETENASSNDGMLGINTKLGFEHVFDWEMWQIK